MISLGAKIQSVKCMKCELIVPNSRPLAPYGLLSKVQKSVHWTLHFMIIFLSFSHTSAHPQECNRLTLLMPYPSWLARTAYNETWNVIEIKTHRPHTKVTWRKSERNYTLEVQCFRIFSKDFFFLWNWFLWKFVKFV